MSIIDAVRRHFGPRWKYDIRELGREAFTDKLAELQREINQLQRCCDRLRLADLSEPDRERVVGSDIRVVSQRIEAELVALHGWTVSLVESVFVLIGNETGEESAVRKEWKMNM